MASVICGVTSFPPYSRLGCVDASELPQVSVDVVVVQRYELCYLLRGQHEAIYTVNSRIRHDQVRHTFSLGTKSDGWTHFLEFSHI